MIRKVAVARLLMDARFKGIIHWVSEAHAIPATVRLYDRLFSVEEPEQDSDSDWTSFINPDSLTVIEHALVEPSLANAAAGARYQFERTGYFCVDEKDSREDKPVFNRTITLRDTWARVENKK